MARFAYCDWTGTIWQFDSANPSVAPFQVHTGESNISSIAFTTDKEFQLVWGPSQLEVRKTKGTQTDTPEYTHGVWLGSVRVRNVSGKERVYFSARKSKTSGIYEIYQLKNNKPVLYHTIDPKELTFPNPCDDTSELFFYGGDFAFGDGNTLYLSTGRIAGPKVGLKIGIYRIKNAGPDTVTGGVERIHLSEGPIDGLCYRGPQTLYFLRDYEVHRLDLNTMTESLEGTITTADPKLRPYDLTYVNEGLLHTGWTTIIIAVQRLLTRRGGSEASRSLAR